MTVSQYDRWVIGLASRHCVVYGAKLHAVRYMESGLLVP